MQAELNPVKTYVDLRDDYIGIPDLHIPKILDKGKNYEYATVEKVPPHRVGTELIDEFTEMHDS